MPELATFDRPPPGLFDVPAHELARVLPGPSLVSLGTGSGQPIFISLLLHGNETSGWSGLCGYLRTCTPKRPLLIFIGNVEAAAAGVRALSGQQDYNRIWRASSGAEATMARALLRHVERARPLAALDLHNNTGRNPHYAVLTTITPATLGLAYLFAETAVWVEEPDTVLTRAVQAFCPAITVELGPIGDPRSEGRATSLIRAFAELSGVPTARPDELRLHRALARVHIRSDVRFSFADDSGQSPDDALVLTSGMEAVNFHLVPAGTVLAQCAGSLGDVIQILDAAHSDVTHRYLHQDGSTVVFRKSVIPAMYTTDRAVIRQDCLCYLMELMG